MEILDKLINSWVSIEPPSSDCNQLPYRYRIEVYCAILSTIQPTHAFHNCITPAAVLVDSCPVAQQISCMTNLTTFNKYPKEKSHHAKTNETNTPPHQPPSQNGRTCKTKSVRRYFKPAYTLKNQDTYNHL